MNRYRQALAQYMAEQQPVRMAEGGLTQSNWNDYIRTVYNMIAAGQLTNQDEVIGQIANDLQVVADRGESIDVGLFYNALQNVGKDFGQSPSEIDEVARGLNPTLLSSGYDFSPFLPQDPPPPEDDPVDEVDPGGTVDDVGPGDIVDDADPGDVVDDVDSVDTTPETPELSPLEQTLFDLTQAGQSTGDYSALNQYLQDQQITQFGLETLYPNIADAGGVQSLLDQGVEPFGYTPPVEPEPTTPTVDDIPQDFYSQFQSYYQGLDSEDRGSLSSELKDYVARNVDVGGILASAGQQDYEFGGGYGGEFTPEIYDPGLVFAGYRPTQARGVDIRNPFGEFTLSEAEAQRDAIAPTEAPTFSQDAFRVMNPGARGSLIRNAVRNFGLDSPEFETAVLEFGVTPEQISSAVGRPMESLPQGLQSITPESFNTRSIPGVTPSTFVPQVSDITSLSDVSTGLPSLRAQPLPTYNPISFSATPEQVAAATIGAMNAAEAEQS